MRTAHELKVPRVRNQTILVGWSGLLLVLPDGLRSAALGRSSVVSNLHSFKYLALSLPLKLSMQPFCMGRPGWNRIGRMP